MLGNGESADGPAGGIPVDPLECTIVLMVFVNKVFPQAGTACSVEESFPDLAGDTFAPDAYVGIAMWIVWNDWIKLAQGKVVGS